MTAWARLQVISQIHANQLWKAGAYGWGQLINRRTGQRGMYNVPEEIQTNCKILGSGDEERIKARLYWYLTYYPAIHKESGHVLQPLQPGRR